MIYQSMRHAALTSSLQVRSTLTSTSSGAETMTTARQGRSSRRANCTFAREVTIAMRGTRPRFGGCYLTWGFTLEWVTGIEPALWETILANESGPKAGVEGVAEDVKGRAKE